MENPGGGIEQILKNELRVAIEISAELMQKMQKVPKNSPTFLLQKGALALSLSATWSHSHLTYLTTFATRAGVISNEDQIVGFKFRGESFTLVDKKGLDQTKKPMYLDEKDLGNIHVSVGGDKAKAVRFFPEYRIT